MQVMQFHLLWWGLGEFTLLMNGGLWKQDSWTGLTLSKLLRWLHVHFTCPADITSQPVHMCHVFPEKLLFTAWKIVCSLHVSKSCMQLSIASVHLSQWKETWTFKTNLHMFNQQGFCVLFFLVFVFSFGACCIRHIVFLLAISTDEFQRKQKNHMYFLNSSFCKNYLVLAAGGTKPAGLEGCKGI